MEPIAAFVVFFLLACWLRGPKFRPWVVGICLMIAGFAAHLAFGVWAAGWAGRFEMALLAIHEATLFLTGLGCVFISLVGPWQRDTKPVTKVAAWSAWLVALIASAWTVLIRLPP